MPQLEEDEWPADGQPTTTEQEVTEDHRAEQGRTTYPPDLPPDATPTRD
jgi:hypothetical protein